MISRSGKRAGSKGALNGVSEILSGEEVLNQADQGREFAGGSGNWSVGEERIVAIQTDLRAVENGRRARIAGRVPDEEVDR